MMKVRHRPGPLRCGAGASRSIRMFLPATRRSRTTQQRNSMVNQEPRRHETRGGLKFVVEPVDDGFGPYDNADRRQGISREIRLGELDAESVFLGPGYRSMLH